MPVKKYKPTSPGKRHRSGSDFSSITRKEPEKSLLVKLVKKAGRNSQGRMKEHYLFLALEFLNAERLRTERSANKTRSAQTVICY